MSIEPVWGDGKDLRGFLCIKEPVPLLLAVPVGGGAELVAYDIPKPVFKTLKGALVVQLRHLESPALTWVRINDLDGGFSLTTPVSNALEYLPGMGLPQG